MKPQPCPRPLVLPYDIEADTVEACRWLFNQKRAVVIVDGYNVGYWKWNPHKQEIAQKTLRENVERRLRSLDAAWPVAETVVVWDGLGLNRCMTRTAHRDALRMMYSAKPETADDLIVKFVKALRVGLCGVVVTNDNELRCRVKDQANVVPTETLWALLPKPVH